MVSPAIKREIQLFFYIFSAKFFLLWKTPGFIRNLYTNTDLVGFKRFSFDWVLKSSQTFFSNLLILEDQEINNCQFKKYYSQFLQILHREYLSNQQILRIFTTKDVKLDESKSNEEDDAMIRSFSEFYLLALLVKTSFLQPKKFETFLNFSEDEKRRNLLKEIMKFFKLGENYFGVEESDFFFLGNE